jgi:hypothetical protein
MIRILTAFCILFLISCASNNLAEPTERPVTSESTGYSYSSEPSKPEVLTKLGNYTVATYYILSDAKLAVASDVCTVKHGSFSSLDRRNDSIQRAYTSELATSYQDAIEKSASGIDKWVEADKGNTYTITNYEFGYDSYELEVLFMTLNCKLD